MSKKIDFPNLKIIIIFGATPEHPINGNLCDDDQATLMLITRSVLFQMEPMSGQMKGIDGGFQIRYAFI